MEEYFDVVDEEDRVLRSLPRSEVHRHRYLHRAVHVFVFRPTGEMLIHRRSQSKEEFPGVWTSSCSGHVSAGETYAATAPRELWEELRLEAARLSELRKFAACAETSWEFTTLYWTILDGEPEPDPEEIDELRWLPVGEIQAWLARAPEQFSPAFRILFRWYLEQDRAGLGRENAGL